MDGIHDFARNMEIARKRLKIYQKDLAERTGLTKAAISAYEKGIKFPTLENALKIAEALNTTVDELCGIKSKSAPQTYADVFLLLVEVVDTIKADIEEKNLFNSDCEVGYSFVTFNETISRFMADWEKVLKLYNDGTIDSELYEAWKMKKWQDYKNIPFYTDDGKINDPEKAKKIPHFEEIDNDDLPF